MEDRNLVGDGVLASPARTDGGACGWAGWSFVSGDRDAHRWRCGASDGERSHQETPVPDREDRSRHRPLRVDHNIAISNPFRNVPRLPTRNCEPSPVGAPRRPGAERSQVGVQDRLGSGDSQARIRSWTPPGCTACP